MVMCDAHAQAYAHRELEEDVREKRADGGWVRCGGEFVGGEGWAKGAQG